MQCMRCGHALSAAELAGNDCPYCGTVLPHRARAAEKVAVVEGLLSDADGNGVPDVLDALHAGGGTGSFQVASGLGPFTTSQTATITRVHSTSVVTVNGQPQPNGQIPEDLARILASSGIVLPGMSNPGAGPVASSATAPSSSRFEVRASVGFTQGESPRSATGSTRSPSATIDQRKTVLLGLLVGSAIGLGLASAIGIFLFRR